MHPQIPVLGLCSTSINKHLFRPTMCQSRNRRLFYHMCQLLIQQRLIVFFPLRERKQGKEHQDQLTASIMTEEREYGYSSHTLSFSVLDTVGAKLTNVMWSISYGNYYYLVGKTAAWNPSQEVPIVFQVSGDEDVDRTVILERERTTWISVIFSL